MASKRFSLKVMLRVALLFISLALTTWLWFSFDLQFVYLLLLLIMVAQVYELLYFLNHTNRELQKFLNALKHEDYTVSFSGRGMGGSFSDLTESFNSVVEKMKSGRAEKESRADLMKLVLENIRLGLIILNEKQEVEIMNTAAREILNLPHFNRWEMFIRKKPEFAHQLQDFAFEGRKLIELKEGAETREIFLDLDHINLLGQTYHLISFSDLKNEIEKKEIDAWHKLIRILAHEVMNSVTPVTSLSQTIKNMLTDDKGEPLEGESLDKERIDDILLALDTIIRRSSGMLNFVDDYRKLTKLPAPNFEVINVAELFDEVCQLMSPQAAAGGVSCHSELLNKKLSIKADRKMLEQVLINLIGNAIHSMESQDGGEISLTAEAGESQVMLQVQDTGAGIPEDILPSIFIPFFSTRKNGTGIGLTLSKNIMQLHRGGISVQSKEGEGTVFRLSFPL